MDDDARNNLLGLNEDQLGEVAKVCNRFPVIDMKFDFENGNIFCAGQQVTLNVNLVREYDEPKLSLVHSLTFPFPKEESWWLLVGDPKTGSISSIKRFSFVREFKIQLKFEAPHQPGEYQHRVYLFCDSWVGCDQDDKITFQVIE